MRRLFVALAAVAGLVFSAGSVGAEPLSGGQLSISIGTLPGLTVPAVPGNANSTTGNAITFPGGTAGTGSPAVSGTTTFVGITNAPPITQVQQIITGNASGTLVPGAGLGANALGLRGVSNVVGYGGSVTLVGVPLSAFGDPGATFMTVTTGGGEINFTGTGWTTAAQTIMVPSTTIDGSAQTPTTVTVAGTNMLSNGAGQITLISPTLIRTNLAGDLPTIAALTLQFAPEPGVLLLQGGAIAALGVLGWRRRKR